MNSYSEVFAAFSVDLGNFYVRAIIMLFVCKIGCSIVLAVRKAKSRLKKGKI